MLAFVSKHLKDSMSLSSKVKDPLSSTKDRILQEENFVSLKCLKYPQSPARKALVLGQDDVKFEIKEVLYF